MQSPSPTNSPPPTPSLSPHTASYHDWCHQSLSVTLHHRADGFYSSISESITVPTFALKSRAGQWTSPRLCNSSSWTLATLKCNFAFSISRIHCLLHHITPASPSGPDNQTRNNTFKHLKSATYAS